MHPAFSVIFFTVLSGAGYGVWLWTVLATLRLHAYGEQVAFALLLLFVLGFVMVAVGLSSSVLHLGQPQRAWRAFSQWRTSWLSREGVLAVATFVPFVYLAVVVLGWLPHVAWLAWLASGWLALGSLATIACTAMIYASLAPVPAWQHKLVVPGYLAIGLHTGGLIALAALWSRTLGVAGSGLVLVVSSMLVFVLKRRYWSGIDRPLPLPRAAALGLPRDRNVRVFERPHTEASYLTKEMGYVLARRHAARLRTLALVLIAGVPAGLGLLLVVLTFTPYADVTPALVLAAGCALLGAFVERWLFFAEAKHLVTLYY